MQYRSLCCDSESMFNLVVYSSTHSLVDGTGDAIIQGRATVQRFFLLSLFFSYNLFPSKSKTFSTSCLSPSSKPTLRSSCSRKGAYCLTVIFLKSSTSPRTFSRSISPATPRPLHVSKILTRSVHERNSPVSNSLWTL
jgi:hypothetical protein